MIVQIRFITWLHFKMVFDNSVCVSKDRRGVIYFLYISHKYFCDKLCRYLNIGSLFKFYANSGQVSYFLNSLNVSLETFAHYSTFNQFDNKIFNLLIEC